MRVEVISTEELGDRSYLVHDGRQAIVVDPQRDLDRVDKVLAEHGLGCAMVLETHIHNDYVTGGFELARRSGVPYVVSGRDPVTFDRQPVEDGDELTVGALTVRVVATPGHTDTHLSYVVSDGAGPAAVFTGGSLLYGSVGRTDLVDPARTEELTRAQFRSAHRLAADLPDDTEVYPTHGFGSFCSSGSATGDADGTIGVERNRNDALVTDDEDSFVRTLIANLTAYPAYYAHMAPLNLNGPGAPDLSAPEPVDPAELRRRIDDGQWVVDLRDRTAYAADHVRGSIGIALGQQFATYLGWLMPWGRPLTLIGADPGQIADAQLQLVRIGVDRPAGAATGTPQQLAGGQPTASYRRATFTELPDRIDPASAGYRAAPGRDEEPVLLDVRRDDERAHGFIPGSAHLPLHRLLNSLDELPAGQLWVHCASGYRAGIAASLLDRAGRDVVWIDDSYDNAAGRTDR